MSEWIVKSMGWTHVAGGVSLLLITALDVIINASGGPPLLPSTTLDGVAWVLFSWIQAAAGAGLIRLRTFGRDLATGISIFLLPFVPWGTRFSVATLYVLWRKSGRLLFSADHRDAVKGTPHLGRSPVYLLPAYGVIYLVAGSSLQLWCLETFYRIQQRIDEVLA